jgi:Xaa-Pro dipeptidase
MNKTISPFPPDGMVQAQRIAIAAAEYAVQTARLGVTEWELSQQAEHKARELGAAGFWTTTMVGFGAGSLRSFPSEPPTQRPLWRRDVGHIDIQPVTSDNWRGDCTRTLVVGDVPEYAEMKNAVNEVHKLLLRSVRPGMPAFELYEIFLRDCQRLGFLPLDRLHNIGHSIGKSSSFDLGFINRHNRTPMWEAWAIEPFFGNHLYGVKMEDVVWFGPDGCLVVR